MLSRALYSALAFGLLSLGFSACPSPANPPPAAVDPAPTRSASGKIEVTRPLRAQEVSSPLTITGTAAVFESHVSYRIRARGQELAQGTAIARSPDVGKPGPFEGTLTWKGLPAGTKAELEVYAVRASDGAPDHVVTIPLILK